jgi:hypothetical protein
MFAFWGILVINTCVNVSGHMIFLFVVISINYVSWAQIRSVDCSALIFHMSIVHATFTKRKKKSKPILTRWAFHRSFTCRILPVLLYKTEVKHWCTQNKIVKLGMCLGLKSITYCQPYSQLHLAELYIYQQNLFYCEFGCYVQRIPELSHFNLLFPNSKYSIIRDNF